MEFLITLKCLKAITDLNEFLEMLTQALVDPTGGFGLDFGQSCLYRLFHRAIQTGSAHALQHLLDICRPIILDYDTVVKKRGGGAPPVVAELCCRHGWCDMPLARDELRHFFFGSSPLR